MATKVSKEKFKQALACDSAEELLSLAKTEGWELSKEDAEKFVKQNKENEIDIKDGADTPDAACIGAICGTDICLGIGLG